jgi:hypothetical protein
MKDLSDNIYVIFFYLVIFTFIYQGINWVRDIIFQEPYCYTQGQRLNKIKIKCSELNSDEYNRSKEESDREAR